MRRRNLATRNTVLRRSAQIWQHKTQCCGASLKTWQHETQCRGAVRPSGNTKHSRSGLTHETTTLKGLVEGCFFYSAGGELHPPCSRASCGSIALRSMSSPQPASAVSAAAEASAGDPRFAQLLLDAYQWLETLALLYARKHGNTKHRNTIWLPYHCNSPEKWPRDDAILWVPSTPYRVGRRSQHAFPRWSLSLASAAHVWHTARRAMSQRPP